MDQPVDAFKTMPQRQVLIRTVSVLFQWTKYFIIDALPGSPPHCLQGMPLPAHGDAGAVRPSPPAAGLPLGKAEQASNRAVSAQYQYFNLFLKEL